MDNNAIIKEYLCNAGKGQSGTSTLPLEFLSSEQIWRSPFGEANPFLPNRGFQTQAGWLPVLARRWLACPTCCELRFPAWGKAVLGDLFSGWNRLDVTPVQPTSADPFMHHALLPLYFPGQRQCDSVER